MRHLSTCYSVAWECVMKGGWRHQHFNTARKINDTGGRGVKSRGCGYDEEKSLLCLGEENSRLATPGDSRCIPALPILPPVVLPAIFHLISCISPVFASTTTPFVHPSLFSRQSFTLTFLISRIFPYICHHLQQSFFSYPHSFCSLFPFLVSFLLQYPDTC